jgi:hypothetical protein
LPLEPPPTHPPSSLTLSLHGSLPIPVDNTTEEVSTSGLSSEAFEALLKQKVATGLKMDRGHFASNKDRALPVDVVEAHKHVKYLDDSF